MYAIINKVTGKWLYGTDYRYNPPHQRTSDRQAVTYEDLDAAERQFRCRRCGRDYEIVEVELNVIGG